MTQVDGNPAVCIKVESPHHPGSCQLSSTILRLILKYFPLTATTTTTTTIESRAAVLTVLIELQMKTLIIIHIMEVLLRRKGLCCLSISMAGVSFFTRHTQSC